MERNYAQDIAGYGGPAIRDGEVYILDGIDNAQDVLRCLDLDTGRELWHYAYGATGKLGQAELCTKLCTEQS